MDPRITSSFTPHGIAGSESLQRRLTADVSGEALNQQLPADSFQSGAASVSLQQMGELSSNEAPAAEPAQAPDPIMAALDIREKLGTLKGAERDAYIEKFRAENGHKIFVSIDMHNHQPIYRPDVHPADTPEVQRYILGTGDAENRREVYRDADAYAIEAMQKDMSKYPHFGFQVSFTGSLAENMEKTAERGLWPGKGWNSHYKTIRDTNSTPFGNPRLDLVNIGYNHPLMGLIASGHDDGKVNYDKDIELQIKMHQQAIEKLFGGPISKGFFPPEMAFSERMVPSLKKVGVEWAMVDNLHFDRANQDYQNPGDGLKPPNKADMRNPGTHSYETLPNDLAKTHLVSPDALRPHYVKHTDPVTGNEELMVVVPEERSLSSYIQKDRDGGKLQEIITKFQKYNNDSKHPLFVLYATDGDNNGSNSGEFHRNVPIDMATRYPNDVVFTTVSDYLELFPPEKPKLTSDNNGVKKFEGGDVVHVEDGSWWGANLGDPQFSKWIDDPAYTGYSPKNNSWATLTAAKNEVITADQLEPAGNTKESIGNIIAGSGSETEKAWHGLLVGQTSCYEYWEPGNILSYSSVKGANMAVEHARNVISKHGKEDDKVGPSVFLPMHHPYNPKGFPGNFNVVTYAYDVNGVKSVKVKYRIDEDGKLDRPEDFKFDGKDVKKWDGEVTMSKLPFPDLPNKPDVWVDPKVRADVYRTKVELNLPENAPGGMVQYYVEAEDNLGNITKSPLQNVYVNNAQESPAEISNDELHNRLKSGDPGVIADTVAFVFNTGRNDVNIFNHVFFRMENGDAALSQSLEALAAKGKMKVSGEPKFKDEFITRLDKHLVKPANAAAIKGTPHFKEALVAPLQDQQADPRVARILAALQ